MKKINLKAYAKLNLIFSIKEKRLDWYHEIEAVNTELDIYDEITLKETDKESIYIECKDEDMPKAEYNLCYRAAELIQQRLNEKKGVIIELKKNIPMAAGLGGGSADAAAVMKGINKLWELNLTQEELIKDIFRLTSDGCYSIVGNNCHVKGRGDVIEKLGKLPKLNIIVIMPKLKPIRYKTKTMYKLYDQIKDKKTLDIQPMLEAIKNKDINAIASLINNSFHEIQYPEYEEVFKLLQELKKKCMNACLCGSGPAIFGICKDQKELNKIYEEYKDKYPFVHKGTIR